MAHNREKLAHINFRPLAFCALGLIFGVFLYGKISFGGLFPSDFLFLALFLCFALRPFSLKRLLAILLSVCVFAGVGALALFLYCNNYENRVEAGEYRLAGTVLSVSAKEGYSLVVLNDLAVNGEQVGGKCRLYLSSKSVLPADELVMTAKLEPIDTNGLAGGDYLGYLFAQNVRYTASASSFEVTGRSENPFLRLNGELYRTLFQHLDEEGAGVAYALLTGNSGNIDEGLLEAVSRGGIVHIFAVSGLHIGTLFGAVYLVCRRLGKYRFLPALFLAFCYCVLCNFTISSVRAVIMCGAFGALRAFGKKYDFLDSISLAAVLILLFSPAQWFAAGFRLTFGACLGLALFSGSFMRLFSKLRLPKGIRRYLAATLSIQIFILPVQLESYGFISVFSTLLNLIFIPVMPVLFLTLILCAACALLIAPAAGFFLALPKGMLSAFLYIFSVIDPSLVLTGFALGTGTTVWLVGCLALSERFRLSVKGKMIAATVLACVFSVTVIFENAVFVGCKIEIYSEGDAALIQTCNERVLVIDDNISLKKCEDFLSKTYGGKLDMIVVLSEDALPAINTAAFLKTKAVRARAEIETGLQNTNIVFGENFSCGELQFVYQSNEKLTLSVENLVVEFDFSGNAALGADLFLGDPQGRLKYFLKNGRIKTL